jgi:hypothetical protein
LIERSERSKGRVKKKDRIEAKRNDEVRTPGRQKGRKIKE